MFKQRRVPAKARRKTYAWSGDGVGADYDEDEPEERHRASDRVDGEDLRELRRLYDSEIRFTDGHIGRLLEQLRESGAWEDTLIIVTADHGEEFLDHGQFGHAKSLYEELVGVPLLIKAPARLGIPPPLSPLCTDLGVWC